MAYFDLDIAPIVARAAERGDVRHVRHEIRDFDPFSLRQNLPEAVRIIARAFAQNEGKVYIHCTAGESQNRLESPDDLTGRCSLTAAIQTHVTATRITVTHNDASTSI
jgi:protein tyrosine phosphatase (PTP) superfamily phosphohydrolase (DUF442 family)